ncbi:MAG: pantothenate synthase [Trichoglossum hirsutum]|nr:MAG: pantothenate synthase [Trichoglossum hirsutum]
MTPKVSSNVNALNNTAMGPIQIFRDVRPLRDFRRQLLLQQKSIGLVPTMGALHAGHLSLIRLAAQENTNIVVSIYVNPLQFGINEDLDTYPRTWEKDLKMLMELDQEFAETNARMMKSSPHKTGADTESDRTRQTTLPLVSRSLGRISAIFAPTTKIMYPTLPPTSDNGTFVTVTPLASLLEGASRPVFFRGVATVCMKLFNIVTPDKVYFGQKDVQQTVVIKRMVKDLCVPTDVVIGPTMREDDGLAMSSRNIYLGQRRRQKASILVKALSVAEEQYMGGKLNRDDILGPANGLLESLAEEQEQLVAEQRVPFEVDYISLADAESLEEVRVVDETRGAILSGAIKMLPIENPQEGEGGEKPVRLIDNIILKPTRLP